MKPNYAQIKELIAFGAGMEVSAQEYSYAQLKELAAYAGSNEKPPILKISNASKLKFDQLKEIAAHGSGSVFFVFD